jgi:uncharacterized repeat protein (TIGR03803 family)
MDGNFYGTTFLGGGNADNGTVYTISSSGTYRKLHAFHPSDAHPLHSLTLGIDGKFYGSTAVGTIFRITSSGDFTDLSHTVGLFDSGLIQGRDGNFYGTAPNDGPANAGTVFKMTPAGQITVLHNFTGSEDGEAPYGGVVQATDGNFYGTTYGPGCGTIFRISSAGSFATLYTLPNDGSMGCSPYSGLLQHTNGLLYGLTISGGTNGNTRGVFFSFDVGLAPFVSFLPAASRVGQTVGIFGQGFTGTTAVSFNNIPAQFTVVSDTYLTAPVPSGATTGFVTVTTPGGTLTGNKKFQVRPQVLSFSPASGAVGTTVVITGVSLGGATQVTFDGVETPFSQNSDTQVTARVPSGAATGHVGVTTTGAASYGHTVFVVTQ